MGEHMKSILIVDDEPDLCWALERMLQADELAFSTAYCGAAALDMVCRKCYTVAFLDAILPDANGIQLAAQIHAICPCTKLVLMSGYYYPEDESLSEAPIAGFLAKPFLRSDVHAILQQALSADRRQQGDGLCNTSCSSTMRTICSG